MSAKTSSASIATKATINIPSTGSNPSSSESFKQLILNNPPSEGPHSEDKTTSVDKRILSQKDVQQNLAKIMFTPEMQKALEEWNKKDAQGHFTQPQAAVDKVKEEITKAFGNSLPPETKILLHVGEGKHPTINITDAKGPYLASIHLKPNNQVRVTSPTWGMEAHGNDDLLLPPGGGLMMNRMRVEKALADVLFTPDTQKALREWNTKDAQGQHTQSQETVDKVKEQVVKAFGNCLAPDTKIQMQVADSQIRISSDTGLYIANLRLNPTNKAVNIEAPNWVLDSK